MRLLRAGGHHLPSRMKGKFEAGRALEETAESAILNKIKGQLI